MGRSIFLRSLAHELLPHAIPLNPKLSQMGTSLIYCTDSVSYRMPGRPRVSLGAGLCQIVNSLGLGFFHPISVGICCYTYSPNFIHLFFGNQLLYPTDPLLIANTCRVINQQGFIEHPISDICPKERASHKVQNVRPGLDKGVTGTCS